MISKFKKYAGFKVLIFFLLNPSTEIHIKQIAKDLKISPSTAKFYCDYFSKEGFFNLTNKGNLKIFSLNNQSIYIKELKKTFALIYFKDLGMENIVDMCISFAIYGSYASGEFTEDSDLDLIVIGNDKGTNKDFVLEFERKIGKQVQLTVIPYYKWEKMKKNKDAFALEVLSNHLLIKGAPL